MSERDPKPTAQGAGTPAVNPHTGQPVPPEPPAAQAPAAAAAATPAAGAQAPAAGAAPSQQELAVRGALETVMDPEIVLIVSELGLIREHLFRDPPKTLVRMMLTTPFCPYAPQMIADVKQAVTSVVPQECEVEIMPDAWSPDLMADPGLLGFSY